MSNTVLVCQNCGWTPGDQTAKDQRCVRCGSGVAAVPADPKPTRKLPGGHRVQKPV